MADEYFRETAINGGSILSLVSAQPILRKGGYCVFLFAGTSTLVHYTRKQKKTKQKEQQERDSAAYCTILRLHTLNINTANHTRRHKENTLGCPRHVALPSTVPV